MFGTRLLWEPVHETEASLRTMILLVLLTGPAFGAPVTSHYPCIQGREQDATDKLQQYAKAALASFFKRKGIDVNTSTLQFSVSLTNQTDVDGAPFVGFAGNAGQNSGLGGAPIAGTVAANDGTKFDILLSSGSDDQDMGDYRVVGTQRGFDREGNAIDRHCRLQLFDSGDAESTKSLLVLNAGSGHVLGLIPLPAQIPLY
jgi:hypothetical protein